MDDFAVACWPIFSQLAILALAWLLLEEDFGLYGGVMLGGGMLLTNGLAAVLLQVVSREWTAERQLDIFTKAAQFSTAVVFLGTLERSEQLELAAGP